MSAKAPLTHPQRPEDVDPATTDQPIEIDEALIDETARVDPDENLRELSNPDEVAPKKGVWRERDANRRSHGADDLKA